MATELLQEAPVSPTEAILPIIQEAVRVDASDIYLVAGAPAMLRVDGETRQMSPFKLTADETRSLAEPLMSPEQREEFHRDSELNIALSLPGVGRFRVNLYVQRGSVAMVLRRIKTEIPKLETLGLPPQLQDLALLKNGLILVVGATGSGKSTTLAAMVGYRNRMRTGHIVTVEDPIEFLHANCKSIVSQREVGSDTDTFASALRNALRQAPDVILIGEMRDRVSVEAALSFAETGQLVLSSLHSTDAAQTIERVLQFYSPDQHGQIYPSLANNLRAVIAQRLVPRADGGRIAAIELMMASPLVKDLLRRHDTSQLKKAVSSGKADGMQSFDQHLFEMYESHVITSETALAFANSANDMRLRLRGMG